MLLWCERYLFDTHRLLAWICVFHSYIRNRNVGVFLVFCSFSPDFTEGVGGVGGGFGRHGMMIIMNLSQT